ITIDVLGDTLIEPDETFHVALSNPVNATLGAPLPGLSPLATGTILNDDQPMVGLFAAASDIPLSLRAYLPPAGPIKVVGLEGNSGTSTLLFPVFLAGPAPSTVYVDYQTVAQSAIGVIASATASIDYVPAAGTLTFYPGETLKSIAVTINGD